MSNQSIKAAFERGNGKAFIPFMTCGDPDLETTRALVKAAEDAGADIIELGIPFSDPTAEGPVIQNANLRALNGGVTTDKIFDLVEKLRGEVSIPLVFMTYGNIVFHYGIDRFCARAEEVGIDGLILPDTPYEEKEEFAAPCRAHNISYISLIAPTSADRIAMIAREAEGFVYCVSSLGVTGTRSTITTDISSLVGKIKESTDIPVAVGFGISDAQAAADMASKSDGAIVGSAIVKLIAEHSRESIEPVHERIEEMASAVHAL